MNSQQEKRRREAVRYWLQKAKEALESAGDEMEADRLSFSVNRRYYACFYAASAALLHRGLKFGKHSGVRAAFHKNFVKSGDESVEDGRLYDELFEARHRGDYMVMATFTKHEIDNWLPRACELVNRMRLLANIQEDL